MLNLARLSTLCILLFCVFPATALAQAKPNVILIYSDDQGWGDAGFNGATDVLTPNLDSLAQDGIVFDQGYVSHPYCSPSRAGLITGRYQQRFGHENNPAYKVDENVGLPLEETTIADEFQRIGYQTAAIGKWHLGDHEKYLPNNRGFDYWFGFSAGGMSYWGKPVKPNLPTSGVVENGKPVPLSEITYLTDDFTNASIRFVEKNADKPFFIYLAYNAPHMPGHAPKKYLKMSDHIEDGKRAVYASMVSGIDHGIGRLVDTLKQQGIYQNTLIVFASDNGGHTHGASSYPYRGHKGMLFEGGIRVPFLMSWPAKLKGGKRYNHPISSLDIMPTTLAAAGLNNIRSKPLDGKNLLPYLTGENPHKPHETLYWRYSDGAGYAVRHGDYKLVMSDYKKRSFLFDMVNDPLERVDLSTDKPQLKQTMTALYNKWDKQLIEPLWQDPHLANVKKEEDRRKKAIQFAHKGEGNR